MCACDATEVGLMLERTHVPAARDALDVLALGLLGRAFKLVPNARRVGHAAAILVRARPQLGEQAHHDCHPSEHEDCGNLRMQSAKASKEGQKDGRESAFVNCEAYRILLAQARDQADAHHHRRRRHRILDPEGMQAGETDRRRGGEHRARGAQPTSATRRRRGRAGASKSR